MRTKSEIFTEAHKLAKIILNDEYNLTYRQALSQALTTLWYDSKKLATAKERLSKEQINLIFSNLQCKYNAYSVWLNDSEKSNFESLKQYSYKNWPTDNGHIFFFSTDLLNNLK